MKSHFNVRSRFFFLFFSSFVLYFSLFLLDFEIQEKLVLNLDNPLYFSLLLFKNAKSKWFKLFLFNSIISFKYINPIIFLLLSFVIIFNTKFIFLSIFICVFNYSYVIATLTIITFLCFLNSSIQGFWFFRFFLFGYAIWISPLSVPKEILSPFSQTQMVCHGNMVDNTIVLLYVHFFIIIGIQESFTIIHNVSPHRFCFIFKFQIYSHLFMKS